MNILFLIVFGGVVGWIASMIMKTNASQGMLGDILLGVVGAVVGGLIMNVFGQSGVTGFNLYSIIVGVIGSVALIGIGRMLFIK